MKYVNIFFITRVDLFLPGRDRHFLGETNQETENRTKVNITRHASNNKLIEKLKGTRKAFI